VQGRQQLIRELLTLVKGTLFSVIFFEFDIWFWNWSNSVVFFVFCFFFILS